MNFQNQIDFLQMQSEDMLSGVEVPAPLQADTLKTQIVFRCGLLEPQYTEPESMQAAITQFFRREQWNIRHLVNIILAEYSPIENTDRYSDHTVDRSGSRTLSETGSGSETHSGTDQRDIEHSGTDERDIAHSGTDTTTNTVSAYNSSTYQPDNKSDLLHGENIGDNVTYGHKIDDDTTYGHQVATTGSKSITDENEGTDTYTEHTHGNIGTMMTQSIIRAELELLRHFDVYDWIAAKLENELFIQVY